MENNQKKKYVRADTRRVLDLQAEKNGVKVKPKLRKQNEAFPHYTLHTKIASSFFWGGGGEPCLKQALHEGMR